MTTLGRGSEVHIGARRVSKITSRWEAEYIAQNQPVFVNLLKVEDLPDGRVRLRMNRHSEPSGIRDIILAFRILKRSLWSKLYMWEQPPWREELLAHLLKTRDTPGVRNLVSRLRVVGPRCFIHGDPTLANLLWDEKTYSWRWIDPLDRSYIPLDRAVDVGKGLQSCWQYEDVLRGETEDPRMNVAVGSRLCDEADVPREIAIDWCYVHMIRLIPYQDARCAAIFRRLLDDAGL